jgi:hypothetical protein
MFRSASTFNQDISSWCVEQIPIEPSGFASNAPLPDANKPIWGATCNLSNISFNNENLVIYPNPAQDQIFINNSSPFDIKTIQLTDMNGKTVDLNHEKGINLIEVSSIASGIYLLQLINADGEQVVKKIVIK